jgi:hypothetical protein
MEFLLYYRNDVVRHIQKHPASGREVADLCALRRATLVFEDI